MKLNKWQRSTLNHAMNLIMEVRSTLDDSRSPCESCGTQAYTNRDEYQMAQTLDACINRLDKTLNRSIDA